jgi:hypothetical protein
VRSRSTPRRASALGVTILTLMRLASDRSGDVSRLRSETLIGLGPDPDLFGRRRPDEQSLSSVHRASNGAAAVVHPNGLDLSP